MDTTHTSGAFTLHSAGSFSPTVGDWVITSAKSPDPVTKARYTIVGRVPAHIEGNPLWDYPTDEELHAIALMFKAAPDLLAALTATTQQLIDLQAAIRDLGLADDFEDDSINILSEANAAVETAVVAIAQAKVETD